ncbi:DUF4890 domain-containing protein [Prevotella sp. oral taxon 299]|uniref:DUF4890 domain-containing protein n=1 Tax=Prevotella sp. oral taxon 299 TaxID=652716 RepID=UPI0001C4047C|nr:DUF4890 domain-containing protein [Prevotella sp. oral taxon 299]EFC71836.1 hypothetical protein HMPREF0669_00508 [Prevotella sp. oral taxon 299 str. F0039]
MKKMMFSLLAMLMFCSTAFAQGCCKKDREKKDVCKGNFAQKRTEQMVERYGLNSDQKAKLLAVNTAFFEKYGKKCNGCPNKDQANKDCCGKKQEAKQCCCKEKQEAKQCCCNKKECSKEAPGNSKCNQSICEKENNKEQVKADVAKYKSDLKQIFTKEQYEKYENDIKERQEHLKVAMEKRQAE